MGSFARCCRRFSLWINMIEVGMGVAVKIKRSRYEKTNLD
jgi:hypothetical protein